VQIGYLEWRASSLGLGQRAIFTFNIDQSFLCQAFASVIAPAISSKIRAMRIAK